MNKNIAIMALIGLVGGALAATGIYHAVQSENSSEARLGNNDNETAGADLKLEQARINSEKIRDQKQQELEATIAQLRQEIHDIKAAAVQANSAGIKTKEQADKTAEPPTQDKLEQRQLDQDDKEYQQLQKVSAHFSEQPSNTEWSITAAKRIETALGDQKVAGLNVDNVECRGMMCKLEINEIDDQGMTVFRDEFRQQVSDIFSAGMVGQDETGKTVIYVAQDAADIYDGQTQTP